MPRTKENTVFQGKRKEPYTAEEIIEKSKAPGRMTLKREAAHKRIRLAILDPRKEAALFNPSRCKTYDRNFKAEPPEFRSSEETKAKLQAFDKQTLPSIDLANKYFDDRQRGKK